MSKQTSIAELHILSRKIRELQSEFDRIEAGFPEGFQHNYDVGVDLMTAEWDADSLARELEEYEETEDDE